VIDGLFASGLWLCGRTGWLSDRRQKTCCFPYASAKNTIGAGPLSARVF
jgi:hypothetical protein